MKPYLINYLKCVACGSEELGLEAMEVIESSLTDEELYPLELSGKTSEGYSTEIEKGKIKCNKCGQVYPIVKGIPRMYAGTEKDYRVDNVSTEKIRNDKGVKHVQKSFSRENGFRNTNCCNERRVD